MRANRSEHVANVALRNNNGNVVMQIQKQRVTTPFNLYNALRVSCVIVALSCVYAFFN